MNVKVKGQGHQGQKNVLSAADTPRMHTNGMHSLQTVCSSSRCVHSMATRGCCAVVSIATSTLVGKAVHAV